MCNDSFDLTIWWNLNILRAAFKGAQSLIWFSCLPSDYPNLIEYRLKQRISIKIT